VIDTLVSLMRSGVFLATDQQDTCRYCRYQSACSVGEVNKQAHQKQGHHQNKLLVSLRVLRKSS
jgi:positive regulator of sigma E activity